MSTASIAPPVVPSGPGLAAAVARLQADAAAVRELVAAGSLGELSESAVASATVALAGVVESVTAAQSTGLARVAGCGYPASEGYVTPASWWRAKTRISRDAASEQVRLARRLSEKYPTTAIAWADGDITAEHARVLAGGVDGVLARLVRRYRREHTEADLPVDAGELAEFIATSRTGLETELLGLARRWGPETLRIALAQAPLHRRARRASAGAQVVGGPGWGQCYGDEGRVQASLTLEQVGDAAVLTAQVSHEVAAMLRTVLDHYRDSAYHRGTGAGAEAGAAGGSAVGAAGCEVGAEHRAQDLDPVTGQPVTVTNSQRDAAALPWAPAEARDSGPK